MIWRIARILFFLLTMLPVMLEALFGIIACGILWIANGEDYLEIWVLNAPIFNITAEVDGWLNMKCEMSAGNATKNSQTTS